MIFSSEKGVPNKTNIPCKKFLFHGADTDTTYTVKVTLVLNGKAIATAQKKIKALPQDQLQKDQKQNLLVSQLNIQSMINRVE